MVLPLEYSGPPADKHFERGVRAWAWRHRRPADGAPPVGAGGGDRSFADPLLD